VGEKGWIPQSYLIGVGKTSKKKKYNWFVNFVKEKGRGLDQKEKNFWGKNRGVGGGRSVGGRIEQKRIVVDQPPLESGVERGGGVDHGEGTASSIDWENHKRKTAEELSEGGLKMTKKSITGRE